MVGAAELECIWWYIVKEVVFGKKTDRTSTIAGCANIDDDKMR